MKNKKNKAIIFDFMRTLYNPITRDLEVNAKDMLIFCKKKYDCFLISYNEGDRGSLIQELEIDKFFKSIHFVQRKTKLTFARVVRDIYSEVYVIGDRIESEIQIGNQLGFKTIWFKNGKFAGRIPIYKWEHPNYVIKNLAEIKNIL